MNNYIGRFAPSPTGPLHMGSLVAAMASFLDARAHSGQWLVRMEDLDFARNVPAADLGMLATLQRCGMQWDGQVCWQSTRIARYEAALHALNAWVYPCACSRKEIADSSRRQDLSERNIYPGTCRQGLPKGKSAKSFRLQVPLIPHTILTFHDRWHGPQQQNLTAEVGDFILKRADGFWAYQLAVVVDDAAQGITHIVRGADLLDSTARQIYLQDLLGLPALSYLHVPVVANEMGEKLSKQTGALAFDRGNNDLLQETLLPAARFLGLELAARPTTIESFWQLATLAWSKKMAFSICKVAPASEAQTARAQLQQGRQESRQNLAKPLSF